MSIKKNLVSVVVVGIATIAFGEVTTGWQTSLATGNYDWADTANWVNGEINGIFSADLIGSGKTSPTVTFSADTVLSSGLSLLYQNAEQTLTFRGEGGDRTLTVGGDIEISPSVGTKGGVVFGSATANQNIDLNLNGDFTMTLGGAVGSTFYGTISGGALTVTGPDTVNVNLTLAGNGTISSNVTFTTGHGLYICEKGQSVPGCERAKDVRLESGYLVYEGTKTGTNPTKDSIGRLILAPGRKGGGLVRFLNWGDTSYNGAHLEIGEIVREQETMLDVHSVSGLLGKETIDSKGTVNVTANKGVTVLGLGTSGTPQVPVVPWARGSIPTKDQLAGDTWVSHLVTYDADRGFRFLDPDTEYDTYSDGYTGPVCETNGNVRVTGGNVVFTGDNTVNSLSTLTSLAVTITATDGTMKILSGVLDLSVGNNVTFNGNVDFGEQTAYITHCSGKTSYLNGTIKGRDIVIGSQALRSATTGTQLSIGATGDISGDVYVNGGASLSTDNFLPHGEKKGRTYVNGTLRIFTGQVTLNGLSGRGRIIYGQSYKTNLTIGDNDADGDFEGSIERTGGTMSLMKVGAGTQRFGDAVTVNSTLTIDGGTAIFDGEVAASSVTVADGAAIGGKGVIKTSLAFTGNATLAVSKGEGRTLAPLTVNGAVTAGGTITVSAASEDWRGESCVLASTEPLTGITFAKGANVKGLELRNDGKELWARNIKGLMVIIK